MFNHILVPLDRSPAGEQALPYAIKLAQQFGSKITVATVIDLPSAINADWSIDTSNLIVELRNTDKLVADAYLKAWCADLSEFDIEAAAIVVENANPASGLLQLVETELFDTIVMTTHGRSGLSRWLMGSVAEQITRFSTIPIMLVNITENLESLQPIALDHTQKELTDV